MKALIKFFVIGVLFFSFLPLMHLRAAEVGSTPVLTDGTYKPKKKRKAAKKLVSKVPLTSSKPLVAIYVSAEQVAISTSYQSLTTQLMRQDGDKIVPIQKDGTVGTLFDNPKDQQIAEAIIKKFQTKTAFFVTIPASSRRGSVNTIALNKASWTEAEIIELRKLIENWFAPVQVSFAPETANFKPLVIPPSLVGLNALNR